jgi:hypothetical protein
MAEDKPDAAKFTRFVQTVIYTLLSLLPISLLTPFLY